MRGLLPMPPSDALTALTHAMAAEEPALGVFDIDWSSRSQACLRLIRDKGTGFEAGEKVLGQFTAGSAEGFNCQRAQAIRAGGPVLSCFVPMIDTAAPITKDQRPREVSPRP